jgi:CBS domain-containing protein
MKQRKVYEVVIPCAKGLLLDQTVRSHDRLIDAIELMVRHNRKVIAVVHHQQVIGMVRLEDAFRYLGLQVADRAPTQ